MNGQSDSLRGRDEDARGAEWRLCDADCGAVDGLVEAAWCREHSEACVRAARVREVLRLLEAGPAPDASLADATLARVLRAEGRLANAEEALCIDDDEAMEVFMGSGYRLDRVPGSLRARAERIASLVTLVTVPGGDGVSPDLVERTMSRIPIRVRTEQARTWRTTVGSFRLQDLVSIAAVLLIAGSVVWPVMATTKSMRSKTACGANINAVASAMGLYSGDYAGQLPLAAAGFGGGSWMNVGKGPGESNSSNLFTLARTGYASLKQLACPGNAKAPCGGCRPEQRDWADLEQVSYSYQIMFGPKRPVWEQGPRVVILGDASPIIRSQRAGLPWHPLQNSANHGGEGQWVLCSDGSGCFMTTPMAGDDNIWLPGVVEVALTRIADRIRQGQSSGIIEIRGNELPDSATDSFLGP
ncbi:MAG: hypothetical protein DYG92_13800 [Leptolyngbya sp. PLA1]|nr:hypothetical protein [Leptolyngbya sp. PLA1]